MSKQIFCTQCGMGLPVGSKFCTKCGSVVATSAADAAEVPPSGLFETVEDLFSEEGVKKSVKAVGGKFREFTGTEKLEGFSVVALFADVFKKHSQERKGIVFRRRDAEYHP